MEQLINVLNDAGSSNSETRKQGEQVLKDWETQQQFFYTLLSIYTTPTIDAKVRFQAIAYFKNGIDKYWRKTAKTPIADEEKAQIRNVLLQCFQEEDKKLASQCSVATAKIARLDYPLDWPNLLQILMQTVHSMLNSGTISSPIKINALYTFHHVVKTLCSKTLAPSRRMLQQLAPEILHFLIKLYGSSSSNCDVNSLSIANLCLKSMRRLVPAGFPEFEKNSNVVELCNMILVNLQRFLVFRNDPQVVGNTSLLNAIDSYILKIGKFYLELITTKPLQFVQVPCCFPVLQYYWTLLEGYDTNSSIEMLMYERFLVQGMIMLKNIIKHRDFLPSNRENPLLNKVHLRNQIDAGFLTPDFQKRILHTLVNKYLVLRQSDLEFWQDDPESFIQEEDADHWEYNFRACAEKVIMDLINKYKESLAPALVAMLGSVSESNATDTRSILIKEAVYCAIGANAHDLYDYLSFEDWFKNKLINEVQTKSENYHILRRRISIVIGQWTTIKPCPHIHGDIYKVLLTLIAPTEDLAVRITSVVQLKCIIDDWDFNVDEFIVFFEPTVDLFVQLMSDSDDFDSKMKVLTCLSVIVERLENKILPFAVKITSMIPTLWSESEGQNMFRSSIFVILKSLVVAMRADSVKLHEFVIPLIQSSVDLNQPSSVFLLEDGLDLWHAVLQNCPESNLSPGLISMFSYILPLLTYGTESLKKVLGIVESYILLAPFQIMKDFSTPTFSALAALIGELRPEAITKITRVIDTTIQACKHINMNNDLYQVLLNTGLLEKIVFQILENDELGHILANYLNILARLTLYEPTTLMNFFVVLGAKMNTQVNGFGVLLDRWGDKFDNMGHPKDRKLTALALANLLTVQESIVCEKMSIILTVITSVLAETSSNDLDHAQVYWNETRQDEDDLDESSAESNRKSNLQKVDPVYTCNLKAFVMERINACQRGYDGEVGTEGAFRKDILGRIDAGVLKPLFE